MKNKGGGEVLLSIEKVHSKGNMKNLSPLRHIPCNCRPSYGICLLDFVSQHWGRKIKPNKIKTS